MLKIKSLLVVLLITGVILAIYFGFSNEVVERAPIIPSKVQASNADAAIEAEPLLNIEQDLTMTDSQAEELSLISVQDLLDKEEDLSPFDEYEILVLRKYLTNYTVSDEEIPTWFRVFAQSVFLQGGEKNPNSMLSAKVDNNWIGVNAYNHDIQHWEDISANGDVIATGVLASFYRDAKKFPKAESHFQKLLVNVVNKDSVLEDLINAAYMQNEKRAAAYAWYGTNNNIDLSKSVVRKRFNELTNKYSEQEIASELREVNNIFEDLHVNYANPELINLNDIFN
jgi:hypothetical protein